MPRCEICRNTYCEVCGNQYDKAFSIELGGVRRTFDRLECAIKAMGRTCEHCGIKVIGYGAEVRGRFYCSVDCALLARSGDVRPRAA